MSRRHSTAAARKRLKTVARWGRYLLAVALLLAVLGTADRMQATPAVPEPFAAAGATSSAGGGSGSAPTLYAHGDRLRPLVEETGNAQTLNIYGPGGQIIAQVARDGLGGSQKAPHLLADHLGSTRAILDADDNVVARFEYGPHGDTAESGVAAAELPYRYTGHAYDEEQGVYQTPNRTYDPTTGRFLSVDPRRQDASPYVYAGNNPVTNVDSSGDIYVPFYLRSGFATITVNGRSESPLAQRVQRAITGIQPGVNQAGDPEQLVVRPDDYFFSYQASEEPGSRFAALGRTFVRSEVDLQDGLVHHGDDLYWLVGNEHQVRMPLDAPEVLARWRELRPGLANNVVVVDLSGDLRASRPLRMALTAADTVPHGYVNARVIDADGNLFASNGRIYGRADFGAYVRNYAAGLRESRGRFERLAADLRRGPTSTVRYYSPPSQEQTIPYLLSPPSPDQVVPDLGRSPSNPRSILRGLEPLLMRGDTDDIHPALLSGVFDGFRDP